MPRRIALTIGCILILVTSIPVVSFQSGYAQEQQPSSDPLLDSIISQKQQEQPSLPADNAPISTASYSGDLLLDELLNQNNKDQQAKQQDLVPTTSVQDPATLL